MAKTEKCGVCKGVGSVAAISKDHSFEILTCGECNGSGETPVEEKPELHTGDYWRRDGFDYEILQLFHSTVYVREVPWPTYLYDGTKRLINKALFLADIEEGELTRVREPG